MKIKCILHVTPFCLSRWLSPIILLSIFLSPVMAATPALSSRGALYQAANIHASGTVTDDKGQPLMGVTIQVQGASVGTTTDSQGHFSLDVPENSTLTVSYIGYDTRQIKTGSEDIVLQIRLQTSSSVLNQVVVVGYGSQKKTDITGSISSISEKALTIAPSANLQQALQGKAAGLEVQTTGTTPGSSAQIRIRGIKSISGSNTPLIILDGIPYDGNLGDINPDDITSIEVLKDASATAIYGSRGANGVLLVTTKRGQQGPARLSYSAYYGIGTPEFSYPVFNAQEYQAMRNISGWTGGYMPQELQSIAEGKSTDWQDLMYQHSYKTNNYLTVTGGNDGSTYSLGGGYYKETALLPGQDFTRYSLKATIDTKIGKRIHIGLNTMNSVDITNGSQFVNGGSMFPILSLSPLMPAYDSTGKVLTQPAGNTLDNTTYNPLLLKHNNNNWVDKKRNLRTFNSLYAELQILPGLKYRFNLGLDYTQEEDDQFQSADNALNPSYFRPMAGNTASVNNSEAFGYTAENLLYYNKTFGKSKLDITGLYSIQQYHTHNTYATKDSITDDFVQFYDMALSNPTPYPVVSGGETSWALLSYMARINYSYDNRYLITLTGRTDGSSRLASGNKWHQYPAVGLGWIISNESFLRGSKTFDLLKLRLGFGQTSNQAISPYSTLGLVNNSNGLVSPGNVIMYNYGPTIVTGYNVVKLPNPELDWEYTRTLNVALDFGLLNDRITGSIDYYHEHTNNILYSVQLPSTSGVSGSFTTNIGSMQNWGMEFSAASTNVQAPSGFSWTTSLNLFFNRNKLLSLGPGSAVNISNQLFPGYSMTSIYDYKKTGIWQTDQAAEAAKYGALPGQIRLQDVNGDGKIDQNDDRYIIGNEDAKLQGGMTNTFSFKGFDLSFFLYARFGGLLISQIHQTISDYLTVMDGRRNGIKVDYWTPTNPTNWFPEPSTSISPVSTAWTTLGYYDATFVKLKSINLGYTFSGALLDKWSIRSLRLYATVDNVAILFSPFYNKTGIDPQGTGLGYSGVGANSGGGPGNIRSNQGDNSTITVSSSTPPTRSFILGINLNF